MPRNSYGIVDKLQQVGLLRRNRIVDKQAGKDLAAFMVEAMFPRLRNRCGVPRRSSSAHCGRRRRVRQCNARSVLQLEPRTLVAVAGDALEEHLRRAHLEPSLAVELAIDDDGVRRFRIERKCLEPIAVALEMHEGSSFKRMGIDGKPLVV